ncbi:neuronal calcium sensor 1-like isoform X3 [Rhodnius prolixus]|uniref:neuronal calcium sensor 1-like isoform X3 n=1 Tax=Rhodnius prolixus TaxID=13249 RepID=UPI003D18C262
MLVRRDARQSMLEEEGGPKEDGEDEERKERRSIYKKGHLYRRLFTYLRSAWTGVKFNLGVLLNQVSMHDAYSELEEGEALTPRARPQSLKSLTRATRFTEQEIKRIYRGFKAECPSGLVKEDTFRTIYSQFFPQGANTSQYATYVFHTLDQSNNGTLSFQDFVQGLSVLCRGSLEERLRWTFSLYDINRDGKITRDELWDVVTSVYNLLGRLSPQPEEEEALAGKVDLIFQRMDLNKDGVVTLDEFLESCISDETITRSMAVFDSAI